jgi:hypothetical protein
VEAAVAEGRRQTKPLSIFHLSLEKETAKPPRAAEFAKEKPSFELGSLNWFFELGARNLSVRVKAELLKQSTKY